MTYDRDVQTDPITFEAPEQPEDPYMETLTKTASHSVQLGLVSSNVSNQAPPASAFEEDRAEDDEEKKS